jgi:hypothetical protein
MISDATFERALMIAKKEGKEITNENAEVFVMVALAQEMEMLDKLINTSKGQTCRKAMASNMANRMLSNLNN